jgi:hypothetical protein
VNKNNCNTYFYKFRIECIDVTHDRAQSGFISLLCKLHWLADEWTQVTNSKLAISETACRMRLTSTLSNERRIFMLFLIQPQKLQSSLNVSYPKPDEYNLHPHILFLSNQFCPLVYAWEFEVASWITFSYKKISTFIFIIAPITTDTRKISILRNVTIFHTWDF